MSEYYITNSPLLRSDKIAIDKLQTTRQRHARAAAQYLADEGVWIEQHAAKLDGEFATAMSEEEVIFWATSALTTARLLDNFRGPIAVLCKKYGEDEPTLEDATRKIRDCLPYIYDNDRFGLSVIDILRNREELARRKPVEAYGYMLRSVMLPNDEEEVRSGVHAFLPVVEYETGQLRKIAKEQQFPNQTTETLIGMSVAYQRALGQVKETIFCPGSEHFEAAVGLYDDVVQNGTDFQRDLFHSQVFGINPAAQGRYAYSRMVTCMKQGEYPELYDDVVSLIEYSFVGHLGEDAYEPLGIERDAEATVDIEAFDALQSKKKDFLRLVKGSEGELGLKNGEYSGFCLCSPKIRYRKDKSNTFVTLEALAETQCGQCIPLEFSLFEKNNYGWNFLRTDEDVPELFNRMVQVTSQAFDQVMPKSQQVAPPVRTKAAPAKERNEDPVYRLRNKARQAVEDSVSIETAAAPSSAHKIEPWPVEFPDEKKKGVDERVLLLAMSAIDKYQKGLGDVKTVYYKSKNGKELRRLRAGDVRVLLELHEDIGQLVVYDLNKRDMIYRR